ncbi:MAG: hypothetical protein OEZ16_05855 [Chromatiales bacterium]|nr:hypothetical protein [Chromatiales bacterium]
MKLRNRPLAIVSFVLTIGTLSLPQVSQAVPSFARQTGMACISCHSMNFPALNSFGRTFRSQGYVMRGAAPLVEGDDLSLPADLKTSLITKLRYELGESVDGGRGEVQWPDEAALLIGGRAAENIGFLLEAGLGPQAGHADTGSGSLSCVNPADATTCVADTGTGESESDGNFLSYKVHFNVTDKISAVVFGTDGLGVGYGMELMNSGAQRSQRPIENRKGFSAYQRLGTASGAATGVALVYHTNSLMVNYSHWAPSWGNVNANILGGLGHYLRVNYFLNTRGWELGLGASMMGGTIDVGANDPADELTVSGNGIDLQAIGEVMGKPTEIYFSYGTAPSESGGQVYNSGSDDLSSMALMAKVGVVNRTSLFAAYGEDHSGGTKVGSEVTAGVQYMLAQNAKLELFSVKKWGEDYTMLMLFAGF